VSNSGGATTCEDFNFADLCKDPQGFLAKLDTTPAPTLVTRIVAKFGEVETNEIEVILRRRMPGDCPELDSPKRGDSDLSAMGDLKGELQNALGALNEILTRFREAEGRVVLQGTPTPDRHAINGAIQGDWREDGPFPMIILGWEHDRPDPR
jgi:hypothetical protein